MSMRVQCSAKSVLANPGRRAFLEAAVAGGAAVFCRVSIPCHLTNIALRLGRKRAWDPAREEFVGDAEANGRLKRVQREPYRIEA